MRESWRERRRTRALLKADAEAAAPLIKAARAEIEADAQAIREEFEDLRGFPPLCPRCHRTLVDQTTQLSRKKWRWMWVCPWGTDTQSTTPPLATRAGYRVRDERR
jgi:hypothetical protein